jgi:hypothetical protein
MIKPKLYSRPPKTNYEYQEGESIENKVRRITENNEPITDGAPIIYTNREDGVLPAYNIRTDRWDIAQQAMEAVNQANLAKSKNYEKIEQQEPASSILFNASCVSTPPIFLASSFVLLACASVNAI